MYLSGSFPISVNLPEGDLDLVFLTLHHPDNELNTLFSVMYKLCEISAMSDGLTSSTIKNVEFVNARTKLLHCSINNVGVDITVNQISALLTAAFLEDVDLHIGQNHLFNRSLLIIKVSLCFSLSMR